MKLEVRWIPYLATLRRMGWHGTGFWRGFEFPLSPKSDPSTAGASAVWIPATHGGVFLSENSLAQSGGRGKGSLPSKLIGCPGTLALPTLRSSWLHLAQARKAPIKSPSQ